MTLYWLGLSIWGGIIAGWHVILFAQRRVKRQQLIVRPANCGHDVRLPSDRLPPSVAVIIPARNEADHLRPCLASVLAQDYPRLSMIVVDDRSEDQTAAVAQSVAADDQRVRVERITQIPQGWMGKSHALWHGSALARSEWLLFIDTDCRLEQGAIAGAIEEALRRRVELLTLWPRIASTGFWENLMIPLCGAIIAMWYGLREGIAFANGQFVLIRRDAYQRIGGHQVVGDALIEDIPLAESAKKRGVRSWVGSGRDLFSVNMYRGYRATCNGWARIFAGALRSGTKLAASIVWLAAGSLLPFVVGVALFPFEVFAGDSVASFLYWIATLLCVWHLTVLFVVSHRFWGLGYCNRTYLLLYPLSVILVMGILMRSWWWLVITHTVVWRDRRYSIDRRGKIIHAAV